MAIACFQNFLEIQSHLKVVATHLSNIKSEEKRETQLSHLIQQKTLALEESQKAVAELKKEMATAELTLAQKDQQKAQATNALEQASSQAQMDSAQKQIDQCESVLDEIQEKLFTLLEKEESLVAQISELESFLKGVVETRNELLQEINQVITAEKKQIAIFEERISNLLELCEKDARVQFLKACEKHRYQNPLTFLENRSCRFCKMAPESSLSQGLERGDLYQLCDGCTRLFTPQSALS